MQNGKMYEFNQYQQALTPVYVRCDGVQVKAIRLKKKDGTYMIRLHVEKNGKIEPPLDLALDELRSKITKLKNYSVAFNAVELAEIAQKITEFISDGNAPVLTISNVYGFQRDDNKAIVSWRSATSYNMNGEHIVKDMFHNLSFPPYSLPNYSGDLYDGIAFINKYLSNHESNPICASIILYGFSAVLAGYLNKSILLSLSGKSSWGKTTMSKLLLSFYGETDNQKLNTTFNVTLNKMVERLDGINGVATLIDDLSLMPPSVKRDIDNMVYVLESGREKERMRTRSFDRDPATWATTIILTTEEPILSYCDPEKEGAVGRLMEINVTGNDLFLDAKEAEEISTKSKEHYGLLADEFVRRLLISDNLNEIDKRYENEKQIVRGAYQGVMARMAENIAVVTLCGKLLNQLFPSDDEEMGFSFDIEAIQRFLLATAQDNLENFKLQQKSNIIMDDIYQQLVVYALETCEQENAAYVNNGSEVVISSKAFKDFLSKIRQKYDFKPIEIKRGLKESGVLIANDGPYSFNATIGGNSFRGVCLRKPKS